MDDVTVNTSAGVTETTGGGVVTSAPGDTAGAKAGNVTESPATDTGAGAESSATVNTENNGGEGAAPQSHEDNRRFAEQRRKYEGELQRQRAGEAERTKAAVDAAIAAMGIKDSRGNLITTKDQLDSVRAEQAKAERTARLRRMGLDEGSFNELVSEAVNSHPDVQAAKAAAEAARAAEEKAANEQAKQAFDRDLREIAEKYDPTIKSFSDLVNSENYAEVSKYVREKGLSVLEAYKMANFDRITAQRTAAAKQSAINDINNKNHMQSMGTPIGTGSAIVPPRTMEMYRSMGYTDAQAAAAYNKFLSDHK